MIKLRRQRNWKINKEKRRKKRNRRKWRRGIV
jgi:hypothetical protein